MSPQQAFEKAVKVGYLPKVKELIDNPEVDIHKNEDRAFKNAARNGHIQVVKVLLGTSADFHTCNDIAIVLAAHNGHVKVVKLLKKYM